MVPLSFPRFCGGENFSLFKGVSKIKRIEPFRDTPKFRRRFMTVFFFTAQPLTWNKANDSLIDENMMLRLFLETSHVDR